jgi:uncharacterized protein (DUF1499 family)
MPIGRSRAASWARFLGALAVPVLAIAALGSRIGMVPPGALLPVLFAGFALGLVALGLSAYALIDIWTSGAEGAGAALAGIVYASPVLILLGGVAVAAVIYPRLTDVTTDIEDPPALEQPGDPAAVQPEPDRFALQREAYPDITPRLYPLPIADVYSTARALIVERGWTIRRETAPPALPPANPAAAAAAAAQDEAVEAALRAKTVMTQSRGSSSAARVSAAAPEEAPAAAEQGPQAATLQAVARTLVFGFADDVSIRFTPTAQGTEVDMRSASGTGMHDLGQNARRIRRLLADLDTALLPDPNAPPPPAPSEAVPTAQAAPAGQ